MNKMMRTMAASLLAACIMVPGFASAAEMTMKVDYSKFMLVEKNGETWMPLRQIATSLGYTVTWSKKNGIMLTNKTMMQDMDMMSDVYTITLMPGHKDFLIGVDKMMLMKAPLVMKNTAYVTKDFIETYLVKPMKMDK